MARHDIKVSLLRMAVADSHDPVRNAWNKSKVFYSVNVMSNEWQQNGSPTVDSPTFLEALRRYYVNFREQSHNFSRYINDPAFRNAVKSQSDVYAKELQKDPRMTPALLKWLTTVSVPASELSNIVPSRFRMASDRDDTGGESTERPSHRRRRSLLSAEEAAAAAINDTSDSPVVDTSASAAAAATSSSSTGANPSSTPLQPTASSSSVVSISDLNPPAPVNSAQISANISPNSAAPPLAPAPANPKLPFTISNSTPNNPQNPQTDVPIQVQSSPPVSPEVQVLREGETRAVAEQTQSLVNAGYRGSDAQDLAREAHRLDQQRRVPFEIPVVKAEEQNRPEPPPINLPLPPVVPERLQNFVNAYRTTQISEQARSYVNSMMDRDRLRFLQLNDIKYLIEAGKLVEPNKPATAIELRAMMVYFTQTPEDMLPLRRQQRDSAPPRQAQTAAPTLSNMVEALTGTPLQGEQPAPRRSRISVREREEAFGLRRDADEPLTPAQQRNWQQVLDRINAVRNAPHPSSLNRSIASSPLYQPFAVYQPPPGTPVAMQLPQSALIYGDVVPPRAFENVAPRAQGPQAYLNPDFTFRPEVAVPRERVPAEYLQRTHNLRARQIAYSLLAPRPQPQYYYFP